LIEEPNSGSFFILNSSGLNILPTIKSRSILLKFIKATAEELDVTEDEYNFFLGDSKELETYKKDKRLNINESCSFERIGNNIKLYQESDDLLYKIEIYKSIRDFVNTKDYLTVIDKLYFVDEILSNTSDRELVKELMSYTISILKNKNKNLEDLLEIKNIVKTPVNLKNLLTTFYTNI
ncbi:MAG: ATPase, partial [Cetobacterium sp.]